MPRLRQYVSGSGFYLNGFLPGTGHCTWQTGDEGLAYLRGQAVKTHGVELHEEPLLEDGHLCCRLVGGDMVAAGRSIYAADAVHFF